MRHEAGLEKFDKATSLEDIQTENVKKNVIGKVIENQKPHILSNGAKRVYHSLTKDLILNEVFRRVEPENRTMGEYFEQVIQP